MHDLTSLIPATFGVVSALAAVWVAQRRTDRRELARMDFEREQKNREDQREKISRLRPDRIQMLFEVGQFLHQLERLLKLLPTREEHDDRDLDEVAERCAGMFPSAEEIGVRLRLLFQKDVDEVWNDFERDLEKFRDTVEYGHFVTKTKPWPSLKVSDEEDKEHEREYWQMICQAAFALQTTIGRMRQALRFAMNAIDTE